MTENQPDTAAPTDQSAMSAPELARAILDRSLKRPRIASVRRLAEALLAKGQKKAKKKKDAKGGGKKARKLARIPGQKGAGQKAP